MTYNKDCKARQGVVPWLYSWEERIRRVAEL